MLISLHDRIEMIRDVEELPVILSELEESVGHIESSKYVKIRAKAIPFLANTTLASGTTSASEQLLAAKALAQQHLDTHHITLDDLEELGDIMSEMLRKQQEVEVRTYPFFLLPSLPCH